MARDGAEIAAGPAYRTGGSGEDHELTLLGRDRLAAGLRARALLDEQELAAQVLDAWRS